VASVVSLSVLVFGITFELDANLFAVAFSFLLAAGFVAFVIMNYKVFGGRPNASIHRTGDHPGDRSADDAR